MKILNLYAGIGGNRKNWDGKKHDITAVELDETRAQIYQDHFPNDVVVIGDAHTHLLENFEDYDFIWTSPPCPTHSKMRKNFAVPQGSKPKYPDMKLYQEILLLKGYFNGSYVVENVDPWYEPLIKPQKSGRHSFWSDFAIPDLQVGSDGIKRQDTTVEKLEQKYGFDTSGYGLDTRERRKILNNCVHPKIGEAILKSRNSKQENLVSFGETDE